MRRRPGVAAYSEAPSGVVNADGIQGLYATNGGKLFAVGGDAAMRLIYQVAGGVAVEFAGSATNLAGDRRPVFAETEALVVIAGGAEMQKLVLADPSSSRLGGDPPPASHVVANASRLLANDLVTDRSKIRFSGIFSGTTDFSGAEEWDFGGIGTSGFVSAEGRPDPVEALGESTSEVFAHGTTTLEIHTPDPALNYVEVSTREYGVSAPYSVIKADQQFAWLDHLRRFVVTDGRDWEIVSDDIQQTLDDFSTVSDCFGYRVHEGPIDCLVWSFPTEGVTFAYQRKGGWSQWQGYDAELTAWKQFSVQSHNHRQDTDVNVVGTLDGKIGQLRMGVADDLGERIVARVQTGFLDHETDKRKHCQALNLTFERGTIEGTIPATARLRWADAPDVWEEPITIDLGASGDRTPVVPLHSLGQYRRRNWELEFDGPTDLVLAAVTETYEVLDQ